MLQGTGSDVGKSLIVAGLARASARRGWAGRPFTPHNMPNNAAVPADGGEIGRAQALQARAAGVPCPITAALVAVLDGRDDVPTALASLLDRPEADE